VKSENTLPRNKEMGGNCRGDFWRERFKTGDACRKPYRITQGACRGVHFNASQRENRDNAKAPKPPLEGMKLKYEKKKEGGEGKKTESGTCQQLIRKQERKCRPSWREKRLWRRGSGSSHFELIAKKGIGGTGRAWGGRGFMRQ